MRKLALAAAAVASVASANAEEAPRSHSAIDYPTEFVLDHARITAYSPNLIRLEWSADGKFEDRPSLVFSNRLKGISWPAFKRESNVVSFNTGNLVIVYRGEGKFDEKNLEIRFNSGQLWRPGMKDTQNLGGTTRTLDSVSGAVPLEDGILSRSGWALVDDSKTPVLNADGWPEARSGEKIDWYFFGHGHNYKSALQDYTKIAGPIPLPPKYVFGSWWSRYWPYTDEELKGLVGEFREHDVPLSVLVIDMDWHLPGWTGYTWNPKFFPDPEGFLKWVHQQGLHTTLNLHPADGVAKHENAYPDVAKAMGVDPASGATIPFNSTDPKFVDAYFKLLHHPLEKQGIDFWWMDWQQQKTTAIDGLDPLFWLNHLHWKDMEGGEKRPLVFSRWGGLGNHRYQIGFSGDVFSNWESLAFQPYFTSTAGNVGYNFWSHDIGGHQPGIVDPELYARWIQWGALSPILRTHATANPLAERRIWTFPEPAFEAARDAFHLRYELIPYIYTSAQQSYESSLPLCRPLYHEWPERDEAYENGGEYLFGQKLLVAPVAVPADAASGCANVSLWIPPGEWTNWFTGEMVSGPRRVSLTVPLNEIPLFVRGGAIIPAAKIEKGFVGTPKNGDLVLHVWPGDGFSRLYEDDGVSEEYKKGGSLLTYFQQGPDGENRSIVIKPQKCEETLPYKGMPEQRAYELHLHDTWPPMEVLMDGKPLLQTISALSGENGWRYDAETFTTIIALPSDETMASKQITIVADPNAPPLDALRSGLRGKMNTLRAVAKSLGDDTPKEIRAVLRAEPAALPAMLTDKAWTSLADAVGSSGGDEKKVLAAVTRMLGFSSEMKMTKQQDGAVRVTVKSNMLHAAKDTKATIALRSVDKWRVKSGPRFDKKKRVKEWPAEMAWELSPGGSMQTARVEADLIFARDGREWRIPMTAWAYPSLNAWKVIGPFDNPWEQKLDKVYAPELEQDFAKTYEGKDGAKASWISVSRNIGAGDDIGDELFVDLDKLFGKHYEYAVAYAATDLHSPAEMDAVLAIGSDDGVAVWLNGKEVHRNPAGRPYLSKQDRVPVHLKMGENKLLLKISQGTAGWGFGVHVETKDGEPIEGIRASAE